jgi:anti-anti-sigma regulatory factor
VVTTASPRLPGLEPPDLSTSEREALAEFWGVYEEHFDEVADAVEQDARGHPELAAFVGATGPAERFERREQIRSAIVDDEWHAYQAGIYEAGARYAQAGLSFGTWFGAGRALRVTIIPLIVDTLRAEPERLGDAVRGGAIFVDLAMVTIGGAYLEAKERIIRTQEEAIRELSTPVLELRPGLLLLALVGLIDTERAGNLTEQLLAAITARRSTVVIIDVTGVPAIDTAVASHLINAVEAARLMGATGILAGLSTANARTLVGLGIDFRSLHVVGTLADAVEEAEALLLRGADARPVA